MLIHTVWLPDIRFLHPYTWVSISTDNRQVSLVILLREVGYFTLLCVAANSEPELKASFSWMKNTLCTQFSPQNAGKSVLGLLNIKIFWKSMPQDSPRGTGLTAPCWCSWVLYSNLLATSIIIETPAYMRKLLWGHLQRISFSAAWQGMVYP